MKRSLTGLLLALTTLLGACGYHLRGEGGSVYPFKELSVSARDAYGYMVKDVRDMLEDHGVRLRAGAPYKLVLIDEQHKERPVSYNGSSRASEYQMTERLDYEIRDDENLLLSSDRLETQKVYVLESNSLAGSNEESERLRREMRHELVQQLSQRLQLLDEARLAKMQKIARAKAEAEAQAKAVERAPQASPVPVIPLLQR